jgi:ABC-2 type transport system ATP-binding protein
MIWFCGGHGICLTNPGDQSLVPDAILTWLNRYVKRDTTVDTGPRFRFVDQNGNLFTAGDYPVPSGTPVTASGAGTLQLGADGGAGPVHPPAGAGAVGGIAAGITPAKATTAVNVAITTPSHAMLVGDPQLQLSYSGTVAPGAKPTFVFAQLVDDATGIVLGNQITPVPLKLDGTPHSTSLTLEGIAFAARAGGHLTLQLVPTTVAYAQPRLGGTVHFAKIAISLPVATGLTPK